MRTLPIFSIIVPTFNRLPETDVSVRALLAKIQRDDVEIIVVDDGSVDGTADYFTAFSANEDRLRVVWTEKDRPEYRNGGIARNCGLKASRGKFIAFMDCDIVHLADPVTPSMEALESEKNIFVTGVLYRARPKKFRIEGPRGHDFYMPNGQWLSLMRRYAIEIGGYDEEFKYYGNEDTDFAARLTRYGLAHTPIQSIQGIHTYLENTGREDRVLPTSIGENQLDIQRKQEVRRNRGKKWGIYFDSPQIKYKYDKETIFSFPAKAGRKTIEITNENYTVETLFREISAQLDMIRRATASLPKLSRQISNIHEVNVASSDPTTFKSTKARNSANGPFGEVISYYRNRNRRIASVLVTSTIDEQTRNMLLEICSAVQFLQAESCNFGAAKLPQGEQAAILCTNLQNKRNPGEFLDALWEILAPNGELLVVMPRPRHTLRSRCICQFPDIGTLVYNLVLAGFDCRRAALKTTEKHLYVICGKGRRPLGTSLAFVSAFFPFPAERGANTQVTELNWDVGQ